MKNRAACAMISSMEIQNTILRIAPLDEAAMAAAQARLDALVKPPGSLGDLERYAVRLAGIYGQVPQATGRRAILVFSADNGGLRGGHRFRAAVRDRRANGELCARGDRGGRVGGRNEY